MRRFLSAVLSFAALAALTLLFIGAALAQGSSPLDNPTFGGALEYAATAALVALVVGMGAAIRFAVKKTGSELLGKGLSALQWAVTQAVRTVYQTYVEAIKDASADGRLTDEERKTAMGMALGEAKKLLSLSGLLDLVKKVLGDLTGGALDRLLESNIESAIAEEKKTSRAIRSANPQ